MLRDTKICVPMHLYVEKNIIHLSVVTQRVLLWCKPESKVERSGLSFIVASLSKCYHGPLKQVLMVKLVSPSF